VPAVVPCVDRREFLLAVAAPLVLGVGPAAARTRGGTPLALVTADLDASIVAVDVSAGSVLKRVATPADPRSIESVGVVGALVAHTAQGELTLVDSDLRVHPVAGAFGAPRYTAVSPDERYAYVTDSERQEVAVVEVRGRRVVGRVPVGGPARHLGIDRTGSRLWVALGNKASSLAVLSLSEPRRPRVVGGVRPPFLAHDVGFTPGGRRVWVTSGDRARIVIYDAATGTLVRTLNADAPPQHVTFLGGRAFVTSGADAILRVHALDGRLLRSAPVPPGSYNVQRSGGDPRARQWILTPSLSEGTLSTFSPRGGKLDVLRIARSSHDACFIIGT
jgi:DNA-binding beta-propeller fold protein YncE